MFAPSHVKNEIIILDVGFTVISFSNIKKCDGQQKIYQTWKRDIEIHLLIAVIPEGGRNRVAYRGKQQIWWEGKTQKMFSIRQ